MRFSIIIPVYNVEKYIDQCMQTVMGQTFRDYEVIVVDDESPDGSMDIVETWVQKYPEQIHVIHQKNTRQGGARNTGASIAQGEYLIFVDSDDYVGTDMLEMADRAIRQHGCDLLVFGHYPVSDSGKIGEAVFPAELPRGTYVPRQEPRVVSLYVAPWGKVVRREFYEAVGFRFPEKVLYEDTVTRLLYGAADAVTICPEAFYYYRIRENSTMRQKLSPKMLDILEVADLVLEDFRSRDLYETFRQPLDLALIYSILCVEEIISTQEPDNPMQEQISRYLGSRFPDYAANPLVGPELRRVLDCLTAGRFRRYHWRFLVLNRMKEKLLRIPLVDALNRMRRIPYR